MVLSEEHDHKNKIGLVSIKDVFEVMIDSDLRGNTSKLDQDNNMISPEEFIRKK